MGVSYNGRRDKRELQNRTDKMFGYADWFKKFPAL